MNYFDFHTHAFTDYLAERAVSSLCKTSNKIPETNGTIHGLREIMKKYNINEFLLLPVATKPSQQITINNWASEVMGNGLYACGSIHPDAHDVFEEIERIKSLGLYGVKFHSEYQRFCPDEERMFPIYKKIAECGLIAVFHGGWDPFGESDIRCTPYRMACAVKKVPELNFVVAHLGGINLWNDVEKYLAGKFDNLWLDMSVVASMGISECQAERIIKKHGTDKILFGSDCPWDNPENEINLINNLSLSYQDKEKIFFKNAHKLLGIH